MYMHTDNDIGTKKHQKTKTSVLKRQGNRIGHACYLAQTKYCNNLVLYETQQKIFKTLVYNLHNRIENIVEAETTINRLNNLNYSLK